MPASYDDSYECLKMAQKHIGQLSRKATREEQLAGLRILFNDLYQAVRIASMCYEVSNFEGAAAQGGSYAWTREELGEFLQASRKSYQLLDSAPPDELDATCRQWLQRAKAFVERTRQEEARATNMQYARIPN